MEKCKSMTVNRFVDREEKLTVDPGEIKDTWRKYNQQFYVIVKKKQDRRSSDCNKYNKDPYTISPRVIELLYENSVKWLTVIFSDTILVTFLVSSLNQILLNYLSYGMIT